MNYVVDKETFVLNMFPDQCPYALLQNIMHEVDVELT